VPRKASVTEIAKRLIGTGVDVATVYHRDSEAADRFRKEAKESGCRMIIERMDVTDFSALDRFVSSVMKEFGRVDYLINNVGIDTLDKSVHDMTFDEWKLSQDVLLNAPFLLCKSVIPTMRKQGYGRIINIGASSKDYRKGIPGLSAFGVHKGALAIFTKTLALEEITNGITVNMVAPGSTKNAGTFPEEKENPGKQYPPRPPS